jgi:hypothetical protein
VGGPTGTTSADLGTLNPGGSKTVSYWISNVGDVAGVVSARLAVTDAENGCTDAESKLKAPAADDCSQWTTGGEFSKYATVQFLEASAANSVACASATDGNPVLGMAPVGLQAAQTGQIRVDDLTANENKCVVLKVVLPKDKAGNDVQGDTAEIKMNINLAQA